MLVLAECIITIMIETSRVNIVMAFCSEIKIKATLCSVF